MLAPVKEEDSSSLIEKERRQDSITVKILRLQKDLERALQDKQGHFHMLSDCRSSVFLPFQVSKTLPDGSGPKVHGLMVPISIMHDLFLFCLRGTSVYSTILYKGNSKRAAAHAWHVDSQVPS